MNDRILNPTALTAATVLPEQSFGERLKHNAEVTFRSGSTYVFGVIIALAVAFNGLGPEGQATVLKAFPFLAGWGGAITALAAYIAMRLKPSKAISAQTQALLEEIARLRLGEYVKAHGGIVLPAPPAPSPPPSPSMPAETMAVAVPSVVSVSVTEAAPTQTSVHDAPDEVSEAELKRVATTLKSTWPKMPADVLRATLARHGQQT